MTAGAEGAAHQGGRALAELYKAKPEGGLRCPESC